LRKHSDIICFPLSPLQAAPLQKLLRTAPDFAQFVYGTAHSDKWQIEHDPLIVTAGTVGDYVPLSKSSGF
jgi:hypothetical protein